MPNLPWVLSGIVYDIDASTALATATVKVMNLNTLEVLNSTSAADGSFSVTFTSYTNGDILFIEARKTIATDLEKIGTNNTTIDTGLPGRNVNVTVNRIADKKLETIVFRTPIQERQDRIFSPQFNADRVLITGFDTKQTTLTRDVNNFVSEIDENDGLHIKVSLFTRDANNLITSIAERIK
jgi:hypothetical protein